eukprot:Hpha_TRINITY_DN7745_c0_g1::TRINITY_DN7745_c0_g1_i1::g.85438::m.85438
MAVAVEAVCARGFDAAVVSATVRLDFAGASVERCAKAANGVVGWEGALLAKCSQGASAALVQVTTQTGEVLGEVALRVGSEERCSEHWYKLSAPQGRWTGEVKVYKGPPRVFCVATEERRRLHAVAERAEKLIGFGTSVLSPACGIQLGFESKDDTTYSGSWGQLCFFLALGAAFAAQVWGDEMGERLGRALLPLVLLFVLQRGRRCQSASGVLSCLRHPRVVKGLYGAEAIDDAPGLTAPSADAAYKSAVFSIKWVRRFDAAREGLRAAFRTLYIVSGLSVVVVAVVLWMYPLAVFPVCAVALFSAFTVLGGWLKETANRTPKVHISAAAPVSPKPRKGSYPPGSKVIVQHEMESDDGAWVKDTAEAVVVRTDARGVWVTFVGNLPEDPPYCSPPEFVRPLDGGASREIEEGTTTVWFEREEDGDWVLDSAVGKIVSSDADSVTVDWGDGCPPFRVLKRFTGAGGEAAARQAAREAATTGLKDAKRVTVWYEAETGPDEWRLVNEEAVVQRELEDGMLELRWVGDGDSPSFRIHSKFTGESGKKAAEEARRSSRGQTPVEPQQLQVGESVEVEHEVEEEASTWRKMTSQATVHKVDAQGVWVIFSGEDAEDPYCSPPQFVKKVGGRAQTQDRSFSQPNIAAALASRLEVINAAPVAPTGTVSTSASAGDFAAGDSVDVVCEVEGSDLVWRRDTAAATVERVDHKGVWVRWEGASPEDELYCSPAGFVSHRGGTERSLQASPSGTSHAATAAAVAIAVCPQCSHVQSKQWRGSDASKTMQCDACQRQSKGWTDAVTGDDPRSPLYRVGDEVEAWYEEEADGGWKVTSDRAKIHRKLPEGQVELRWVADEEEDSELYRCHTRFLAPPPPGRSVEVRVGASVAIQYEQEGADGKWESVRDVGKVTRILSETGEVEVDWGDGSAPFVSPLKHVFPAQESQSGTQ